MRVIHVIPAISEEASGPTYSVIRLCDSLIEEHIDVTLASLDWSPMASPPHYSKKFLMTKWPRKLGRSPAMFKWLNCQVAIGNVDLLHAHSLWMMPSIYSGIVAKRHKLPFLVSPHGSFSKRALATGSKLKYFYWPLVQRPALDTVTCWHATSQEEFDDIRKLGFRQPVSIIQHGVDQPLLLDKIDVNHRTLLFLGRIHPIKGLDMLLPAWREVQDKFPEWHLKIVGPDNSGYQIQMQQLASKLKLKRIEFSGALYGEQKWVAYRQADLFVLPTYSENFGMAVAEALASGIPSIVTKGAPWSGLETNNAGWWIDVSVDSLIACLDSALNQSKENLNEMGLSARSWMERDFSWTTVGRKMFATYEWILCGGSKPEWVID